jgi:hypothetical protein
MHGRAAREAGARIDLFLGDTDTMRQGASASGRRPRGRSGGGSGGRKNVPLKNQNFDSNGPDVRVRGNATQVYEKYLALARDASSAGDRVIAESYYQHAEHYYRIINENTDPSYEDLYGRESNGYDGYDEDEEDDDGRQQARGTRQERRERYEQEERRQRGGPGNSQGGNGQAHTNGADTSAGVGEATDGQGDAEGGGQGKSKRGRGRPRKGKTAQASDGETNASADGDGASTQPAENASSEDNA